MSEVENCIIIGSGPAGWSAAIYAARANLRPLLFEGAMTEENRVMGRFPMGQLAQTTEVENYAGFPSGKLKEFIDSAIDPSRQYMFPPVEEHPHAVTGPELMELMRQQATNFGTRVITDDIVSVDFSKRPLVLNSSENGTFHTHTVILATGASANYLGLPSEEKFRNRGVSACAVCDGALPRFRDKPLVVVGGGDSAVEEASYLTKYASKVYMLLRRGEMRASKIMQERALANPKIELVKFSVVDEVIGQDDPRVGVTGVRIRNLQSNQTSTLEATGMFLAIGHTPNTKFLGGQVETRENGYIAWKQPYRTITSVEGVFAAGDVADDYYRQAITSAGTGCMAALDAERYLASAGIH
ncbi:MAG: thioredoxin-disulfide reductase [Planctomycetaceae bacterium]|jgi:thioredoxin reductase (NADPH)|nr:thioredoxin-disulfide reductase [Planctomycetaceae bacterium]MCE2814102.1 thioredoxin-disulfide reductase [Planctomycetaceae bacterium]